LRAMMMIAPATNNASMSTGTQGGLSRIDLGTGGVYRDDACTPASLSTGLGIGRSPGRVPLAVVRPPVLRFGGATARQSTAPRS
jgi:hypothetical protein